MAYECYACGRKYKTEPQYCQCGSYQFYLIEEDKRKQRDKRR